MTLSELQQWLSQRQYAEVRPVETMTRAILPDGRRLRGLKVLDRLYLSRDLVFYETILGMAVPIPLDAVVQRTSLTWLEWCWQRATERARLAKSRRRTRILERRS